MREWPSLRLTVEYLKDEYYFPPCHNVTGHAAAIEQFGFYLPAKKKKEYYKAWREYYDAGGSLRFFKLLHDMGGKHT
jgi:hypothetical protein